MTKIIKKDGKFALVVNDIITPITEIVDDGKTLKLPANDVNRKYFSIARFEEKAINNELELTYKESIKIGTGSTRRSVKPLEDFLEGDEKAKYIELRDKAMAKRKEANKPTPLTAKEKALRAIERAKAQLAALEALEASEPKAEKPKAEKKGKKNAQ